jgi:hypothetical protein
MLIILLLLNLYKVGNNDKDNSTENMKCENYFIFIVSMVYLIKFIIKENQPKSCSYASFGFYFLMEKLLILFKYAFLLLN